MKLILTCEHAGNIIPREYAHLFIGNEALLNSHRGYDPGALDLFEDLSNLADYKISQSISRLLIELNRSVGHSQLFSEFTNKLSSEEKKFLLDTYYHPYRNEVEKTTDNYINEGDKVIHLSIHSFTPILNQKERKADIGILFDPSRPQEKLISRKFKENLLEYSEGLKIRYNYPYLGKADGFTTYLRKKFPVNYAGIEVEVNQKYTRNNTMDKYIKNALFSAIQILKKDPFLNQKEIF